MLILYWTMPLVLLTRYKAFSHRMSLRKRMMCSSTCSLRYVSFLSSHFRWSDYRSRPQSLTTPLNDPSVFSATVCWIVLISHQHKMYIYNVFEVNDFVRVFGCRERMRKLHLKKAGMSLSLARCVFRFKIFSETCDVKCSNLRCNVYSPSQ